jgi:uncharacterized OsmC-like protein
MTTKSSPRSVSIERTASATYTVHNARGGTITMASGDGPEFTPVELLLAAIGGCTAVDVDLVTSRRAEPDSFEVTVDAQKVDEDGTHYLSDITVTFRLRFPDGPDGDKARGIMPDIVQRSHDRLCTVGVTVERGTPITPRIE